jgi:hypothetical protein
VAMTVQPVPGLPYPASSLTSSVKKIATMLIDCGLSK